jgi:phosphoglycolate phosphatase
VLRRVSPGEERGGATDSCRWGSTRECIVIGDTPLDVECAKPFGASSIAVATGHYSYESLLETGADYILRDLLGAIEIINAM